MLAKFGTNSGGITWWSKFELIQVLKWIQIQYSWKDNSSYKLYTLGPLCLWQCLQNSSSAIVCHRQTVVISHWIYSPSECHHPMACHHHHQVKCQVCNAMNRTSNDITLAHSTDNYTAWCVHLMTQIPCWQSSSSSTPMNLGIFSHSERVSKVWLYSVLA